MHNERNHIVPVFRAQDFCVIDGANLGDPISYFDELEPDDVYRLTPAAKPRNLAFYTCRDGYFHLTENTDTGTQGHIVHLDSLLTLMTSDGHNIEAIVLVELTSDHHVQEIYLLPLAPLRKKTEYALVGKQQEGALTRFAQATCVSFTRGTHITLADGRQLAIEDLKIGDRVLTRDGGSQAVRWINQHTVRAVGDLAPVTIRAGVLNNLNDLVVSPEHRLFVYQRTDQIGAGRAELLVKARHLVNGESVFRQEGGFIDYFQLLFDRHHLIYAEGIAVESTLLDNTTTPALPQADITQLSDLLTRHGESRHRDLDVQEKLLQHPDVVSLLRQASGH